MRIREAAIVSLAAVGLGSCTSLFYVHDPQSGIISAGQLPSFLKSLRCEMIMFYEIERSRKVAYDHEKDKTIAFARYSHFAIDPTLYGVFTLELKVTDTANLGTGTSFDRKHTFDGNTNSVTHLGPTLGSQGIYDLIWTFIMKQDARLAAAEPASATLVDGSCLSDSVSWLDELEAVAEGLKPQATAFNRITVNGLKPLAAWLRDNGSLMSVSFLSPAKGEEVAEPAQMSYTFSLQASGGLEGKYSFTSIKWTPAAIQLSGSLQQNSVVGFYINGSKSAYANGAKGGQSGFGIPKPPLGSSGNPMYVVEKPGLTPTPTPTAAPTPKPPGGKTGEKIQDFQPETDGTPKVAPSPAPSPGVSPKPRTRQRLQLKRGGETPFFIAPLPINPPTMTPN
jgi:hypothetical protein